MRLRIYTDGACRGNPGPAAIGVVIRDEQQRELARISEYVGHGTNNQAEYRAVIAALKAAAEFKPAEVTLYTDSELVARQLAGGYRVKSPVLLPLYTEAAELSKRFANLSIIHIRRGGNVEADALANAALRKSLREQT
ncbi:MAG: ribonuclease HI family protein [Dehalococcoidia bacterium]|nr:ribonuclease HI family protein [Dehalococcoidia bacterium]